MKKFFSYMIFVVGLVLVMCGSAFADDGLLPSDSYSNDAFITVVSDSGSRSLTPLSNCRVLYCYNTGISYLTTFVSSPSSGLLFYQSPHYSVASFWGLAVPCQAGDQVILSNINIGTYGGSNLGSDWGNGWRYVTPLPGVASAQGRSVVFGLNNYSGGSGSISNLPFVELGTSYFDGNASSPSGSYTFKVPNSFSGSYVCFSSGMKSNFNNYPGVFFSNPSVDVSPSWLSSLPDFALETTQQQILARLVTSDGRLNNIYKRLDIPLSTLNTALAGIKTSVDNINATIGTPSAMEQFENDYINDPHVSGQLDKTEQFISPSNPGLPNGGDVGGFAEQIQNGMGFNGSSFDSEKFQQATDAFKVDSTSTGEGGMWWFFSQEVADSMVHNDVSTVSDDDGKSLQDAWVEQIKRRWGNW